LELSFAIGHDALLESLVTKMGGEEGGEESEVHLA